MQQSILQGAASRAWLPQFGTVSPLPPNSIQITGGSPVHDRFHAEVHHDRVLGADFVYSAAITADWNQEQLRADLQFRISDEGRYGVRVGAGRIVFYRLSLEPRPCAEDDTVIAHCPLWTGESDDPVHVRLGPERFFDTAQQTILVTIVAEGSRFTVTFGTASAELGRIEVDDSVLGVGRFGLYAIDAAPTFTVIFTDVSATTDPTARSNFALLYSTPGYDLDGSKRALVRTLTDLDAADFDAAGSSFTLRNATGETPVAARPFEAIGPAGSPATLRRTLGFQFLAADFSDLRDPGQYTLEARVVTSSGVRLLRSLPFPVAPQLVTERMLWPLSVLNANARRAADDDFRRNWTVESGRKAWSVGLDGAFVADRADDQQGAVLLRVFNGFNRPLSAIDFRFTARITIVSGCDAQLLFRVTGNERWAVTLQAGDAGGCAHGAGPGAVRLHREVIGIANEPPFQPKDSHRLDASPFRIGRAYDVEVRALGDQIEVMLDGERVINFFGATSPRGTFGLKAWGSTVRFGHVKVWERKVGLSRPFPGVWIPHNRATGISAHGFPITVGDSENTGAPPDQTNHVMFPLAAQQHGFHDCNSFMGEVTSHAVFLSGLLEVWTARAHAAAPTRQEDLRRSIITAVLYLNELSEQANRNGAFAHQEPGRAALAPANPILTTQFALYGLSAFADKGSVVDRKLARRAFLRAREAWQWLNDHAGRDLVIDSIVAVRLARAARREGEDDEPWLALAKTSTAAVLSVFSAEDSMAAHFRSTLRSIPWFEGVYEAVFHGLFDLVDDQPAQVARIASQLLALADNPANGFCLIPQGEDNRENRDPAIPLRNWREMADFPLAVYPIPQLAAGPPPTHPVGDWYISVHFATAAADCVYIGRLAGTRALERLATGNLSWILGLNPGIPTSKVVPPAPADGPWSASAFVYNGPGAFARTIDGNRTVANAAKGWLADWETPTSSRHRESWAFDPAKTGFQSIVNGHVLRQNQWHYGSIGSPGWVCGETFMLIDGCFLKAAIALEDWHAGRTLVRDSPYDTTRSHFFDTTHFDRASTSWRFDDTERTPAAQAWRLATDFAGSKGFGAGRPTGHRVGERVGVICLPAIVASFVDVPLAEVTPLLAPFSDINAAHWAVAGRAAMTIAARRGAVAGFFTGHVLAGKCGWIGPDAGHIVVFDVADNDEAVVGSEWEFADIETVGWAHAARLATDVCVHRGFAGGFFTGHHLAGKRQIVAFRHTP